MRHLVVHGVMTGTTDATYPPKKLVGQRPILGVEFDGVTDSYGS